MQNFEQGFEQKLASMTPRILVRLVKERCMNDMPLRSFGTIAASFLLGAGVMYFAMLPQESATKPTANYTGSGITTRLVLDDESLRKIHRPIDIAKLIVRSERVEQPVEPDCTYHALKLRIEN
ncbi:hypothetical protein FACS189443_6610 [Planctomycetales bacterium]|nr:hypothetical protein FACS189443_6610 [Planctomycetales bacterium]